MRIELFSYSRCFPKCKKLRPGFMANSSIWCLTHTRPLESKFLEIDPNSIVSPHFRTGAGQRVYLTKALESSTRYNNSPGGELLLDSISVKNLGSLLGCPSKLSIISLNNNFKTMSAILVGNVLFLSIDQLPLPATQAEMGMETPITRATDNSEFSPKELVEMIQKLDTEADGPKINAVNPAIVYLKKLTLVEALKMCPAYSFEDPATKVIEIPADQYDSVLLNLKAVLNASPLNDEAAMNAFVALVPVFGDADLSVYEPVQNIDPESLKALENQGAEAAAETPATDAPPTADEAPPTDAPTTEAPTTEDPAAAEESAVATIISETAAPVFTKREQVLLNAGAKRSKKLAQGIKLLVEGLEDELDGLVEATTPELPATVEA